MFHQRKIFMENKETDYKSFVLRFGISRNIMDTCTNSF